MGLVEVTQVERQSSEPRRRGRRPPDALDGGYRALEPRHAGELLWGDPNLLAELTSEVLAAAA